MLNVGDVLAKGTSRWRVDEKHADGRVVLQSVSTSWARTIPLSEEVALADGWTVVPAGTDPQGGR